MPYSSWDHRAVWINLLPRFIWPTHPTRPNLPTSILPGLFLVHTETNKSITLDGQASHRKRYIPWLKLKPAYRLYNIPSELEIDMYDTIDCTSTWTSVPVLSNLRSDCRIFTPSFLLMGYSSPVLILLNRKTTLDYIKSSLPTTKPYITTTFLQGRTQPIDVWVDFPTFSSMVCPHKSIFLARQNERPHPPLPNVFLYKGRTNYQSILNLQYSSRFGNVASLAGPHVCLIIKQHF